MTTITIDTPLRLRKTHFSNALEAGDFLLRFVTSQLKKQSSAKNNKSSQYKKAISDLENNKNTISLSDYMQKRGLTR